MKSLFITASILLCFGFRANATIRTVNNNNPSPGQYSTFSAAVTASSNGDTLLITGSNTSYGSVTISKSLVIFGTGHNPQKQNPLVSTFNDISISVSGVQLFGISCNNITLAITSGSFSVKRSSILGVWATGSSGGVGVTIEGNVFKSVGPTAINLIALSGGINISNNIIPVNSSSTLQYISSANIYNNVFIGGGSLSSSITNCSILNNIFYGVSPSGMSTNCFTAYNCSSSLPFNGDNDGNNIVANPLFVNYSGGAFDYSQDFRLQAGSPCITNPGIDGTQRGLYGGNPSLAFDQNGIPPIPQIRQMDASPTTVPAGVPVNINISSTRKN